MDTKMPDLRKLLGLDRSEVYGVIGAFEEPQDLVKAGRRVREEGYTKLDALTPFPVHGIEAALGIRRSILGWIVVCFGILGGLSALGLVYYVGVISYPLVIGGKPLFDVTFSIPPVFELTVLLSAFASLIGMLVLNGLPRLYHPSFNYKQSHRATDDRFLLVVEASDPKFDAQKTARLLESVGARDVEVVEG
jgi:hypothetical protein